MYGPERFGRTSEAIITRVVELTDMRGGDVVVDVGSGDGYVPLAFSALTQCYSYGVELLSARSAQARELIHRFASFGMCVCCVCVAVWDRAPQCTLDDTHRVLSLSLRWLCGAHSGGAGQRHGRGCAS